MNRAMLIVFAGVVCLAALSAAIIQGGQLSDLRAEQRRLAVQFSGPEASGLPAPPQGPASGGATAGPVSPELLRLRSEVTRLTALQRGLAPARAENERLRLQLAAAGTNNVPGRALPPGYLWRADARMAGYDTPEDTLQSLLWALHNKDNLRVLENFTPAAVERLHSYIHLQEDLLQQMEAFIGMAIVGKDQLPDGSVEVRVLVAPDAPLLHFRLKSIDGQWKIASPP